MCWNLPLGTAGSSGQQGGGGPWHLGLRRVRAIGDIPGVYNIVLPLVGQEGRCCIGSHLTDVETEAGKGKSLARGPLQIEDRAGIELGLTGKSVLDAVKQTLNVFILQNSCLLDAAKGDSKHGAR